MTVKGIVENTTLAFSNGTAAGSAFCLGSYFGSRLVNVIRVGTVANPLQAAMAIGIGLGILTTSQALMKNASDRLFNFPQANKETNQFGEIACFLGTQVIMGTNPLSGPLASVASRMALATSGVITSTAPLVLCTVTVLTISAISIAIIKDKQKAQKLYRESPEPVIKSPKIAKVINQSCSLIRSSMAIAAITHLGGHALNLLRTGAVASPTYYGAMAGLSFTVLGATSELIGLPISKLLSKSNKKIQNIGTLVAFAGAAKLTYSLHSSLSKIATIASKSTSSNALALSALSILGIIFKEQKKLPEKKSEPSRKVKALVDVPVTREKRHHLDHLGLELDLRGDKRPRSKRKLNRVRNFVRPGQNVARKHGHPLDERALDVEGLRGRPAKERHGLAHLDLELPAGRSLSEVNWEDVA